MNPIKRSIVPRWIVLLVVMLGSLPAAATVTARIVDESGAPVVGARVCYFEGGVEQVCTQSVARGQFELMDSKLKTMRIVHSGFLPRTLPARTYRNPIVLSQGARILVSLRDAAEGRAIGGEVEIIWPSGRQLGPFPANVSGVRINSLPDGAVRVIGRAPGYLVSDSVFATLEAAKLVEVVIDLQREGAESGP